MFYVYVLESQTTGRLYTGQTASIPKRKQRHEQGLSPSTKGRGPWQVVYQEEFATRAEAMQRERFLKTGHGRDELRQLLHDAATAAERDEGDVKLLV